jgi:hypothetical protein
MTITIAVWGLSALVSRHPDVDRLTVFAGQAKTLAGNGRANGMDAPAF